MRRQQLQFLLLGFAPTLLVVSLSTALLYRSPGFIDLLLAAAATAATFTCNIFLGRSLRTRILRPLDLLTRDISRLETGYPLANRAMLLEPLVIALEQRMAELEAQQQTRSNALAAETGRINKRVDELRESNTSLRQAADVADRHRQLESRLTVASASASIAPLAGIISGVNLLVANDGLDSRRARRLVANARSLTLLARELQEFDYSSASETRFDIRQLVDEAISTVTPALSSQTVRILPFYDRFGQKRFVGNAGMIRALVFNYLLNHALHAGVTSIDLHVSYLADGQLALALSPQAMPDVWLQYARFFSLLSPLGAALNESILTIPVVADDDYLQPETRLRAMVDCHDEHEQKSLVTRLESMRVSVVDGQYDVDVCITNFEDTRQIVSLRDKLDDATHVLLLGNSAPLPLGNTHQLAYPPLHEELTAILLELVDVRTEEAPRVLVIDDNISNLKLLELQLRELGVIVETAEDAATALALVGRHDFSLIIADMQLPDASGIEIATAIKARSVRDIPVVILSAQLSDAQKHKALKAGINQVLIKPATRAMLAQLLISLKLITRVPSDLHRPAITANHTTMLKIFDHALSLKLVNNRSALADEMLEGIMASLQPTRGAITQQFEAGQSDGFKAAIHRFHGALQYCGLPRLKNAIARLETIAGSGREQEIRLALTVFNAEVDALVDWYDPTDNHFDSSILRGRTAD